MSVGCSNCVIDSSLANLNVQTVGFGLRTFKLIYNFGLKCHEFLIVNSNNLV